MGVDVFVLWNEAEEQVGLFGAVFLREPHAKAFAVELPTEILHTFVQVRAIDIGIIGKRLVHGRYYILQNCRGVGTLR